MATPADDPSAYTVDEVKQHVQDTDLDADALDALVQAEQDGKDRVTLLSWLESYRDDSDSSTETDESDSDDEDDDGDDGDDAAVTVDVDEAPADATPERRGPPREVDRPTLGDDDYDPATDKAWAPGEVPSPEDVPLVVVRPPGAGAYAGYWFENGRRKVVRRNRRVDDAIVDGPLEYVGDAPNHSEGDVL